MLDKSNAQLVKCLAHLAEVEVWDRNEMQVCRMYKAIMRAKKDGTPIDLAFVAGKSGKLDRGIQSFMLAWEKYLTNMAKGVANAKKGAEDGKKDGTKDNKEAQEGAEESTQKDALPPTPENAQTDALSMQDQCKTNAKPRQYHCTTFEEKAKEIKDLQEFTPLPHNTYNINQEEERERGISNFDPKVALQRRGLLHDICKQIGIDDEGVENAIFRASNGYQEGHKMCGVLYDMTLHPKENPNAYIAKIIENEKGKWKQ